MTEYDGEQQAQTEYDGEQQTAAPVSTVDPYWTERASPPKQAPAMTPEQASAAIDAKLQDADFRTAYFGEYKPGHSGAVDEMARLHALAHPAGPRELIVGRAPMQPPKPAAPLDPRVQSDPPETPAEGEGEAPESAEAPSEDEVEHERRTEELEQLLGSEVSERVAGARTWLGDELVEAVNASGFGDDPEAITQMVQLSESDPDGLLRESIRELLDRNIYHGAATLERKRLEADPQFMAAYVQGHNVGHDTAVAKMTALTLVERPPKWAVAMLEKHHAQSQSPART